MQRSSYGRAAPPAAATASATFSAGSAVSASLFAMVAPGTSATADDGTGGPTLAKRTFSVLERHLRGHLVVRCRA